jgi:hypothetical protein
MCLTNLDLEAGICNGSQGVVVGFVQAGAGVITAATVLGELAPVVRFTNGCVRVIERHVWQSDEYPALYISQYPLCLAWALTIHKIQGATMAMAEMDLGNAIFEYGQTYVALSRIQTLDGLYLSAFHPQRIKANPKVRAFYDSLLPTPGPVQEDANTKAPAPGPEIAPETATKSLKKDQEQVLAIKKLAKDPETGLAIKKLAKDPETGLAIKKLAKDPNTKFIKLL